MLFLFLSLFDRWMRNCVWLWKKMTVLCPPFWNHLPVSGNIIRLIRWLNNALKEFARVEAIALISTVVFWMSTRKKPFLYWWWHLRNTDCIAYKGKQSGFLWLLNGRWIQIFPPYIKANTSFRSEFVHRYSSLSVSQFSFTFIMTLKPISHGTAGWASA